MLIFAYFTPRSRLLESQRCYIDSGCCWTPYISFEDVNHGLGHSQISELDKSSGKRLSSEARTAPFCIGSRQYFWTSRTPGSGKNAKMHTFRGRSFLIARGSNMRTTPGRMEDVRAGALIKRLKRSIERYGGWVVESAHPSISARC